MSTEKSMGHFTDWLFGVPVKIYDRRMIKQAYCEARLIHESANLFKVVHIHNDTLEAFQKKNFYYELIPYECSKYNSPRYPVCVSSISTAYCNCNDSINFLSTSNLQLQPAPTITIIIDGKNIEISDESYENLKRQLVG